MAEEDDAPSEIEVPANCVGLIIGSAGSTIKRLKQATGCSIEVPKSQGPRVARGCEEGTVVIRLVGSDSARRQAAIAVRKAADGGDPEDFAAGFEGAMVLPHGLEGFDRQAWCAWRLVAAEQEHGVRVEMGRSAVRIWVDKGMRRLTGEAAEAVRAAADAAIAAAKELSEFTVDCDLQYEPENAVYDRALAPLVDQYGVRLFVVRPEGGVCPLKVTGPAEAAKDAAALLEARFVKGKATASVLQVEGKLQEMSEEMAKDFKHDIRELEGQITVKVHYNCRTALWIDGANADSVASAKNTLQQMLQFYFPDDFHLVEGLKAEAIEQIRVAPAIRLLTSKPNCIVALDATAGTAWICGDQREAVKAEIEKLVSKYDSEHFEMDLEDYGAAMWLLGPRGSGEFLQRMQGESGAKIKVCPNACKVWAEGGPRQVQAAERLIKEGLQGLERRKQIDKAGGPCAVTKKPKELLSDAPPHMRAILEKLEMLKSGRIPPELLRERSRSPHRGGASGAAANADTEARLVSAEVREWDPATGETRSTAVDLPA